MNAARIRSKCLKNTFSKEGKKHASREHLTQINTEAVADLIAATGTNGKHAPFNSGGLLSPRIPGLTVPPAPPSCFRSVRQRDTVPAESLPEFLLANCSVLFRGCMSAQADTVSVIITTCSHAPFRSHHLGDIKQPAQEAVLIVQEARLSGPGFQSNNCCLCTNSRGLLPPSPSPESGRKRPQLQVLTGTNSNSSGRGDHGHIKSHSHSMDWA